MGSAIWKVPLLPHTLSRGQCFTWNVGAWRFGVGEVCLWEAGLFRSFWFYDDVVVSRGTWAMLVKEIFCDCSHVSWCLKVSRCFTWNTTFLQQPNCFTWNVGCFCCRGVVFWVLVFLVGGGCFTWNMEASVAGKIWFSFSRHWCTWPFFGGLEKQAEWYLLLICSPLAWMELPANSISFHIRMYMEVGLRPLHSWPSVTGFMTVWMFHVKRRVGWLFLFC